MMSSRLNCEEDKTVSMRVNCKIGKFSMQCIHPQNQSLPIFNFKISKLQALYTTYCDHSIIDGSMGNFRIMDNM